MKNLLPTLALLLLPVLLMSQSTKKVLIIGIDGVRSDALEAANTPNLDILIGNGYYSPDAMNDDITISGPGWSAILCGVWSPKHLVTGNDFTINDYTNYPSIFSYVEDFDPNLNTASIGHWNPINDNIVLNDADYKLNVSSDADLATEASNYLTNNDPDILFLHFDETDGAGHSFGFSPDVPQYISAIEAVDIYLGDVLLSLTNRPTYASEDWLILCTTDHGGQGFSHGGTSFVEERVFFIASGDNVPTELIEKDSTLVNNATFNCLNETVELDFDGSNDYVQIANNSLFDFGSSQDFTIECRMRTTNAGDVAIVGNKDWDSGLNPGFVFSFKLPSGPAWKVNIGDGSSRVDLENGGSIADNEWHTLTVSFDRDGDMIMYEDGVSVDAGSIAGIGDINTNAGLFFGADINSAYDFTGSIAEVRVWDKVIGPTEIADWHCTEVTNTHPDYSNLVGYWKMNDGPGQTTVIDDSGNGNDGSINDAEWIDPSMVWEYDFSQTPRIVDTSPTALTHLCIPVPAAFDGESRVDVCSLGLQVSAFLEGPYEVGGSMNTTLRDESLLPLAQPFNTAPWNYAGTETVTSIPDDVVDWVFIEILDAAYDIQTQRAAFIKTDGTVIDLNGANIVELSVPSGDYYIVIKARNHVGLMSDFVITLPNSSSFDMSVPANVRDGIDQLYLSSDGTYCMHAGDFNGDGIMSVMDFNEYITEPSAILEYHELDIDMDGHVTVDDYDLYRKNLSFTGVIQVRY